MGLLASAGAGVGVPVGAETAELMRVARKIAARAAFIVILEKFQGLYRWEMAWKEVESFVWQCGCGVGFGCLVAYCRNDE